MPRTRVLERLTLAVSRRVASRIDQPVMFSIAKQMNYERARGNAPARHSQVKDGYTNSKRRMTAFTSRTICAAVIFTTSVNSNMDCSVTSGLWGPIARVNGLWLVVTRMVRHCSAPYVLFATYREFMRLAALPRHRIAQKAQLAGDVGCEGFNGKHNE